MPARIYALAKELKVDSKDLVDLVKKVGITGKGSALASLSDEEAQKVRDHLSGAGKPEPAAAPAVATAPTAVRDGVQSERKHVAIKVGRSSSRSSTPEKPAKPATPAPKAPEPVEPVVEATPAPRHPCTERRGCRYRDSRAFAAETSFLGKSYQESNGSSERWCGRERSCCTRQTRFDDFRWKDAILGSASARG